MKNAANYRLLSIWAQRPCTSSGCDTDFDVNVLLAPQKRNSDQPVFAFKCLARSRPIFRRQNSRQAGELRTDNLSAHGAGSDSDLRAVSYSLVFSRVAATHHVQLIISFAKPDWGPNRCAVLAKSCQRDVFLAVNFWRNRHAILYAQSDISAGGLGSLVAASIARDYAVVLKARDAQMDARSTEAQEDTRGRQGRTLTCAAAAGLF
jgi:hypothetical protein